MISRGEVGLIVAALVVDAGVLEPELLTVAVVMVLASTLVTPPLVRLAFRDRTSVQEQAGDFEQPAPIEE